MFCKKCGTRMNDDAVFCPSCRTSNASAKAGSASTPLIGSMFEGAINAASRESVSRGIAGVAAVVLAIVAIVFLVKLVSAIEGVIIPFSAYGAIASGAGIAGFIACGLVLSGCAALAALPAAKHALEKRSGNQIAIERGLAFSLALFIGCIAVWVCKLIFHTPAGGSVSSILYTIFATFGDIAIACLIPVAIAAVILYAVRVTMASVAGPRC